MNGFSYANIVEIYYNDVFYDHQKEWFASILENKYTAILACRQIGKSYILAFAAITLAYLENQNILVISESEEKAKNIIKEVKEHIYYIEMALGFSIHISKSSGVQNITLNNNKTIKAVPGQPTALQGYTGTVMVDELAISRHDPESMVAQALSVSSASDIYRVVICSNADKKDSFVHNFFLSEDPNWKSRREPWKTFQTNIYERFLLNEMKPELLPENFQNIYQSMSKNLWRRFYENEFLAAGSQRFDISDYHVEKFKLNKAYRVIGYDPGFTINPSGVVVVEIFEGKINVLQTKKLYKVEVADQIDFLQQLHEKWKPRNIVIDAGGAIPILQDLKRLFGNRVIPKNVNDKFYSEGSDLLDYFVQTKSISILHNELLKEIEMIEMDGNKIILPEKKPNPLPHPNAKDHCDLFVGLLLCLTQAEKKPALNPTQTTRIPQGTRYLNR